MKRIAIVEYTFLMDEDSPYRSTDQLERDLVLCFAQRGIQAETVDVRGNSGTRGLYLSKSGLPTPTPSPKPMTFKKAK